METDASAVRKNGQIGPADSHEMFQSTGGQGQHYCCHTSEVRLEHPEPGVLLRGGPGPSSSSPHGSRQQKPSLFSAESFQEAHRQLGLATPSPPGTPPTPGSVGGGLLRSSSEDALSSSSLSSQENYLDATGASVASPAGVPGPHWGSGYVGGGGSGRQGECASPFYYHALRFLLVGDSDVGKNEILEKFEVHRLPLVNQKEVEFKTTMILLDGKRIKLQLWDTSGQGRFSTIIQSYSRGADGIILVFDITNRWSFESLDKWLKEVDEYASGVPRVLVGNRLHFEFRREVNSRTAMQYAAKHNMSYLEVSPLADYNITETFVDLSRQVLNRIRLHSWHENRVLSLQELCCRTIVQRTTSYSIERLPLPASVKSNLKSYSFNPYSAASPIACCAHKQHSSKGGCLSHHVHQRRRGHSRSNSGGGRTSRRSSRSSRSSSPHNLLEGIPITNLRHHHGHHETGRKCTIQ
ncbi:ras-related protein Rab-40C-like [Tropilaelaps mercedesae]|uniref:Ras-related protein Rab-40C-like n=1 Tax=Tropilaelaps mercedesae TaxID=418985 RepID=A0A1V9XQY3_9ACAR|nr:ras-related protein Rab-40C-like [Tropilaelaps mercedesae]